MTVSPSSSATAPNPIPPSGVRGEDLIARASRVQQSFNIGDRRIWPNAYLAPMSGVTDICFRRLVSRLAGGRTGLLVSEFVSVQVLTQPGGRDNAKSAREMAFAEEERPFSIQIFGGEAGRMAWGAKIAEDTGCDFVEINCGCPAPKVVQKGGGSGLLKDLPNLAAILRGVKAIKNYLFIIYLLEDEQELSLGMLIRLRRIYNF
jgi:hypothetical protein